jgi:hypothetical protein
MKPPKMLITMTGITALTVLLATPTLSQEAASGLDAVAIGVKDLTTIDDGMGGSRILFNLESTAPAGDYSISRATLTLDLGSTVSEARMRLWIHPVTAPWTAGAAGWTSGWSKPGGDYEETVFAQADVDLQQKGPLSIDVTQIVKEVLQYKMPSYGFIVTADPGTEKVGLSATELGRLQGLASASLLIEYRQTPPRPRGK